MQSMNYSIRVLDELQVLESMCDEYSGELRYLSKRIRKDIWVVNKNDAILGKMLNIFNMVFFMCV